MDLEIYSFAVEAIGEVAGFTLPDWNTHRKYEPENQSCTKEDLPCSPSDPKKTDLRLLTGDLDNPDEPLVALLEVERIIETNKNSAVCVPLVALSGTGKTKVMFDLGQKRCVISPQSDTCFYFSPMSRYMIYIPAIYPNTGSQGENYQIDANLMLDNIQAVMQTTYLE